MRHILIWLPQYRHAKVPPGREIWARAFLSGETATRLRVEVTDASPTLPAVRTPSAGEESGRGLTLVVLLAGAWGTRPRETGVGKTVWFELGLNYSPA
ncbi:ATP-binding protein [Streptomyces sp. NPDC051684]|uniref:ATP-binding protein n=1 Tax=Streptomyces sp. NPDC051684 TaxID=3365670 RepID=UPI0037A3E677